MLCFVHRDVAAVASCKSCGRGACPTCARLADLWVVCSDDCAVEAKRLQQMNLQASKLNAVASKPNYLLPVFFILIGVAAVSLELAGRGDLGLKSLPFLAVGVFTIILGLNFFVRIRRLDQSLRSPKGDAD